MAGDEPRTRLASDGSQVEPLAGTTVDAAVALLDQVFPHQAWWERACWSLRLSLLPRAISFVPYGIVGVGACRYWIAVGRDREVVGVTGLYRRWCDPNALWLGWTAVAPRCRGRGIGGLLIDFAIDQSRRSGVHSLWLYTTNLDAQRIALQAYERRGFVLLRSIPSRRWPSGFCYLYYRLALQDLPDT